MFEKWLKCKPLTQGQQKERQARAWLEKNHIKIIAQNFHCRGGEIDLIGLSEHTNLLNPNPSGKTTRIIFFEVKYRKNSLYGHPAEFVTLKKQQRIVRCAQTFLLKHPDLATLPMQFDVITFEGQQTTPEWIEDAFGA
jgi:putative endonuclease